jgi:hypothetical protein
MITSDVAFPAHPRCECYSSEFTCCCDATERSLRAYMMGLITEPMTAEQREACISEIVYCAEGETRENVENLNDAELARAVLFAWTDFARDKGLI